MQENPVIDPEITNRLSRLEQSCKRWKWVAGSSLGLAVMIAVFQSVQVVRVPAARDRSWSSPVSARNFVVVGSDGLPRASFGLNANDDPAIDLKDKNQKTRMSLLVKADGLASIEMRDPRDVTLATLSVGPDGESYLVFQDREDAPRCMLAKSKNGNAGVWVFDGQGVERSRLFYQAEDGTTRLSFRGRNGKARVGVGTSEGDDASVAIYDKNEQIRFVTGIDEADETVFIAKDKAGADLLPDRKP
jgi:hypothetical protein